jgi:hypothetical protein
VVSVNLNLCEICLERQRTIDQMQQEIQSLRAKVRRLERKTAAGPFGSSTPSAKIPVKATTAEEHRSEPGAAKPGHTGHGRQAVEDSAAVRIETIAVGPVCPHCSGALEHKEYRDRSVIESQPLRAEPILYQLERARCARCGKTVQARAPEVLPKSLYGNQLVTQCGVSALPDWISESSWPLGSNSSTRPRRSRTRCLTLPSTHWLSTMSR